MSIDSVKLLLHEKGLKATQNRVSLLQVLNDYKGAIPYSSLQKDLQPIDRVTLYRTLEVLLDKGIIHKAYQENNDTYYAICDHKCDDSEHNHEHIHFKCTECDTVSSEDIDIPIELQLPNYKIDKVAINIEGVCKKCND
jgi:Fur family transcriptional regulator, ferric uptake regulator